MKVRRKSRWISNDSSGFMVNVSSLTNVGSDFTISANPNLTNVSALTLSYVGGDFTVSDNENLETIEADALASVGGDFVITDSTANTIQFGELAETGGDVVVSNNPSASEICFTNLTRVGGRLIVSRNGAADVLCFDHLTNVASDLEITDATANTVRVEGVVGHFSTYAAVTFRPLGELAITGPALTGGVFSFSFTSQAGTNNTVQFTDSLTPTDWQTLTNLAGDGGPLAVSDEPLTNGQRFYRMASR